MKVEELENELSAMRQRLAELEAEAADQANAGQQLRRDWRQAAIAADLDGDEEAAATADELSRRLLNASLSDERRSFAIDALKGRIASMEAEVERQRANVPVEFLRRVPASQQTFGGLRRALKIPAGGWEPVSPDRVKYEVARQYPDAINGIFRSLKAGAVVPLRNGQWEVKAVAQDESP